MRHLGRHLQVTNRPRVKYPVWLQEVVPAEKEKTQSHGHKTHQTYPQPGQYSTGHTRVRGELQQHLPLERKNHDITASLRI